MGPMAEPAAAATAAPHKQPTMETKTAADTAASTKSTWSQLISSHFDGAHLSPDKLRHAVSVVCMSMILVLLIVCVIVFLLQQPEATKDDTSEPQIKEFTETKTTTVATTKKTPKTTTSAKATTTTTTTTTTRTTTTTTTTPPTKRHHFKRTPLVCVYGSGFNNSLKFPDVDICDLTVFDSLHKGGSDTWQFPHNDLLHFLQHARQHKTSQFGCSFDFTNRGELSKSLDDQSAVKYIDEFWYDNIHHYGMVDISPYQESQDDVINVFELFKTLYDLLDSRARPSGDSTLIFIGFSPLSAQWISFVPSLFDVFRPDIFIFRGHYSLVNHDRHGCEIVPPTLTKAVHGFPFTLATAHEAVKELAAKDSGNTSLAVSVTMAGRWNRPLDFWRYTEKYYAPFQSCTRLPQGSNQFGSIFEVCLGDKYKTPHVHGEYKDEYRYNFNDGLSFTYDSSVSLKRKLCGFKSNMTKVSYGVAVFDMQYEDWTSYCYVDTFARLRTLKRVTQYFVSGFQLTTDPTDCWLL